MSLQSPKFSFHVMSATVATLLAVVGMLGGLGVRAAQAQAFSVIHGFSGGLDGWYPEGGLTMDAGGSLYGTAFVGGYPGTCYSGEGCGTVFKLTRKGNGWILSPIYIFKGGNDGAHALNVAFGPDGSLYGTTLAGGIGPCSWNSDKGCGTVFKLTPPASSCTAAICLWNETILYRFAGGSDAASPVSGVAFDSAGNLYGTTPGGGANGYGTVYKLTPSGGGWTESVIFSFEPNVSGSTPYAAVIFDKAGNMYGTTVDGAPGCTAPPCSVIYELTPSGSGWTENILYSLHWATDGAVPQAPLVFDSSGNLYGTTSDDGLQGGGTAFLLTHSGGGWTYTVLYSFTGTEGQQRGPNAPLLMDASGNLYGTTGEEGTGYGTVFELTPTGGGWTYTALHIFTAGGDDGGFPSGPLVFDVSGNLYGTGAIGGFYSDGVVWKITP